ncbi:hypothetical protein OKW21_001249 [Catalinimonas alkaloidigena]|nr:hypothetical protein [Catalinimonas alkaloidigena]
MIFAGGMVGFAGAIMLYNSNKNIGLAGALLLLNLKYIEYKLNKLSNVILSTDYLT